MKIAVVTLLFLLSAFAPAQAGDKKLPTLKSLSTPSCPACQQMAKVLDEINAKYKGKLVAEKININEHEDLARQYNVRYVPTLLFLDAEGKVVAQEVGYRSLDDVLEVFQKAGVSIQ